MYDDIRAYIKATIATATGLPVSFIDAKKDQEKPYITFDLTENYSDMVLRHNYTVTVDIWDESSPKNCINAVKSLDKTWKQAKETLDAAQICVTLGSASGFADDEDETLCHYIRSYEIKAYERGEN